MTTISPRQRSRAPIPAIIVVLAVLVVVGVFVVRAPVSDWLWRALGPAVSLRNSLSSGQVSELQAQLASTTAALADRNALYQENVALKAELGRTNQLHIILAGVLQHPPQTPYDTLTLDAGSAQGVAIGDLVYAGGTYIIGTITDVYDTTSRATLLSAPGQTYQAFLNDTTAISLRGQGAGSLSGEVPAGTSVQLDNPITAPGVAGGFLGNVSHVDLRQGASFETIYTQLPSDLFSLKYVEIEL